MRRNAVPQIIREAIDTYPGRLCFSMPDGRPILVNHKMNELVSALTGHTILNGESVWKELSRITFTNGCKKLLSRWSGQKKDESEEQLAFSFPDGSIWRYRHDTLSDKDQSYIQLETADITELYHLSEELYETNSRLRAMYQRQKELLENIVQINREKELVTVKMRVHDELGQCLIATRNALREETISENADTLANEWQNAIRNLTNIPLETVSAEEASEAELLQVAHMIGCQINFVGERPSGRRERLLLYAAVREALTNAVRHAKASCLTVVTSPSDFGYHMELSDNGIRKPCALKEGSGLGNLRQRLEREGATLQVDCTHGVKLILDIPSGAEERKAGAEHDESVIG